MGTNRTIPITSLSGLRPVRVITISSCTPRLTGATSRPPTRSRSSSGRGTCSGAAVRTIASYGACPGSYRPEPDVEVAQLAQQRLGPPAQLGHDLDGVDLADTLGQHGSLVARAGADLQHPHVAAWADQRRHPRHDRRLADGLAGADGQGPGLATAAAPVTSPRGRRRGGHAPRP
jgi:hypothetical protein